MIRHEITYHKNFEVKRFREYVNGILIEEIHFNDEGDKHGTYSGWYPNGQLFFIINFDNGYKNGDWIRYHENGNLQNTRSYSNGTLIGTHTMYDNNGTPIRRKIYKDGELIDTQYGTKSADWYLFTSIE